MMAQMFLCIIPRLPATGIALCKKETPSTSKLCRDRKARRRPTSQRLRYEGVGNHSAGRKRPPAGLFFVLEQEYRSDSPRSSSTGSPAPSRIGRKRQPARAGRGKRDERQDWRTAYCLRTGHEALLRLIPAQGKQNLLALRGSSQRGLADELAIRLKKNRYQELLRSRNSLKNQEGLHFQAMIRNAKFQQGLLSRTTGCKFATGEPQYVCAWPQPCGNPKEHSQAGQATRDDNRAVPGRCRTLSR